MNLAPTTTPVAATLRVMWCSARWRSWKAAGAVLTNTGMSAILLVTTVFLKPGDLLVAPHDCYGGSYRLFDSLAKRGCYRVLFVDQNDEQALRAALAEKPKLVLVESPSNPLLRVVDIAKICGWRVRRGDKRGG
jgi:cystathionine gamma-synthase